jgi:hypothetical protein
MHSTARLGRAAAAVGIALTLTSIGGGTASAASARHEDRHQEAVFVQSDTPSGNTVVAYARRADGMLTQAGVHPTGGLGGVLAGSVVDHLASQGSLALDDGLLYAVNAGSANLSGFTVAPTGALNPLGITATGAGTVDAASSSDGRYLYVQTGAAGRVDEFRVAANGSLSKLGTITVPDAVGGQGIAAS